MILPDPAGETDWIEAIVDQGHESVVAGIEAAMDGRRPRLAAKLLAFLSDDEDAESVARARKAASLLLLQGGPAFEAEQELELAWALLRRRTRARVRERLGRSSDGHYRR